MDYMNSAFSELTDTEFGASPERPFVVQEPVFVVVRLKGLPKGGELLPRIRRSGRPPQRSSSRLLDPFIALSLFKRKVRQSQLTII
jgi:hypothetical protein